MANLQVTFQAAHVQRLLKQVNLHTAFPHDRKEQAYPFTVTHWEAGYQIVDAKFAKPVKDAGVRNPSLAVSQDKTKVVMTGELVKPAGIMAWQKNPPPLQRTPTVDLTLEQRSEPVMKTSDPITAEVQLPGTTLLPLPKLSSRWDVKSSMYHLELFDGTLLVFQGSKLPVSATLQYKNHPYHLTAIQEPDNIRLELIDAKATLSPIGN